MHLWTHDLFNPHADRGEVRDAIFSFMTLVIPDAPDGLLKLRHQHGGVACWHHSMEKVQLFWCSFSEELYRFCFDMTTGGETLSPASLDTLDSLLPEGWQVNRAKDAYEALVPVVNTKLELQGYFIWENSD